MDVFDMIDPTMCELNALRVAGEAEEAKHDCEGCRADREAHDLPDVHALYAHYLQRMTDYVLAKGVTPIIWEGFSKEYNHLISKTALL